MESQKKLHTKFNTSLLFTLSLSLILITNGPAAHAARNSLPPAPSPYPSHSPDRPTPPLPDDSTPESPTELPFITYKHFFPHSHAHQSKPPPAKTPVQESIGFPGIGTNGGLGPPKPNPEIEKICDLTDYPPLCIAAVLPHMHGQINMNTVFTGTVQAGNDFAKYCVGVAKQIASNPETPPDERSVYQDCKDGYETMVDNFVETLEASQKNDMGTMKSMLSAVLTFAGDCEDQLDEMELDSPLKDFSVKLKNMTSNCLAITDIMEGKAPMPAPVMK